MTNTNYNKNVLDHFKNPRNMGEMENPDAEGTVGNPTCGDVMRIMLRIKEDKIEDIRFLTFGCAAAIATSSVLTTLAKGKTIEEAKKLTNRDVAMALGDLPKLKFHCSNLAADALQKAIKNWKEKNSSVS